jgi:hypothetical protein
MRRRVLAVLAALLMLAGCGGSYTPTKSDQPDHRLRPGSNQNPDMDAP